MIDWPGPNLEIHPLQPACSVPKCTFVVNDADGHKAVFPEGTVWADFVAFAVL